MSYLESLTLRLAAGAMRLTDDVRRRHAEFLTRGQNDDGGFSGREGESDLYYTGFALRGLALTGEFSEDVAARSGRYLQERLAGPMPSIDFLSLVSSAVLLEATSGIDVFAVAGRDRKTMVTDTLEPFRRDDGGYAKTDRSPHSSTYHTFLAAASKQLVGAAAADEAPRIVALIRSRKRDDGGFVELAQIAQSGANPTAAAIGLLRLLDAMDEPTRDGAAAFLAGMQNAEGGLRANGRIPLADLLSSFTGLVALADLDALARIDLTAAQRYVEALEQPGGGFRGGVWDDAADVEYAFYGLGALALL
ncbi:MAG: beta-hydroxylase, partial [Planctomycetes bacterium]|nr:beta-hydroxylase [Planctomycetota bacterium]